MASASETAPSLYSEIIVIASTRCNEVRDAGLWSLSRGGSHTARKAGAADASAAGAAEVVAGAAEAVAGAAEVVAGAAEVVAGAAEVVAGAAEVVAGAADSVVVVAAAVTAGAGLSVGAPRAAACTGASAAPPPPAAASAVATVAAVAAVAAAVAAAPAAPAAVVRLSRWWMRQRSPVTASAAARLSSALFESAGSAPVAAGRGPPTEPAGRHLQPCGHSAAHPSFPTQICRSLKN